MILKKFHSDFLYYFNILVVYFDLLKFVLLCKTSILILVSQNPPDDCIYKYS